MRTIEGGRLAIIMLAALLFVTCAGVSIVSHTLLAFPQMFMLAAFVALVFFERRRYGAAPTSATATATGERFRDPTSGQLMEVYYDDQTGARSYRPIA